MTTQSHIKLIALFFACCLVFTSCQNTLYSAFELDRRSGNTPSPAGGSARGDDSDLTNYSIKDTPMSRANFPQRSAPVIEKVWVFDRRLGPNWLQGTWYYIELQSSEWLDERVPENNTFVEVLQSEREQRQSRVYQFNETANNAAVEKPATTLPSKKGKKKRIH